MTVTADDLGILGNLATALGILRDGSPDPGWFGDPAARLKQVLADDDQREALLAFLDAVLDDGELDRDEAGRVFVPLVRDDEPSVAVGIVLEPTATTVRVGLRAEVTTARTLGANPRPASETTVEVALFQTGRGAGPAPPPLLLGRPGGRIRVRTSVTLGPASGSGLSLGGIGVEVDVPTAPTGDGPPRIGLRLQGLQLPGRAARDVELGAGSLADLDDALVELVLGLIQSQAATDTGPLRAIAALAGLAGALPPLPVSDLLDRGVPAFVAWLDDVLGDPATRGVWLGHLAGLFPGGAVQGDAVAVTFGSATVRLRLRSEAGPSGHVRLTPSVEVDVGDPPAAAQARVDLCTVDLGTGSTVAVPALAVWAHLGRRPGTSEPRALELSASPPAPAVRVDAVRVGLALDRDRRPVFVLAADGVEIGSNEYDSLDLTSVDALMDVGGAVVDDVIEGVLGQLGSVADAARLLLGLTAPAGHTAVDPVTLADFARDPLGAVAGYWHGLVTLDPSAVAALLAVVRDVLGSATGAGSPVRGDGTPARPWRVTLVRGLELQAFVVGAELRVGVAAVTSVDTLGERCTVIDGTLALEVATVDLAGRHARVMTGAGVTIDLRGRGISPERMLLDLGAVRLEADHVRVGLGWSPASGVAATIAAPNLVAIVDGGTIDLTLPGPGAPVAPAAWDALERLIGLLAPHGPPRLASLVALLGWTDRSRNARLPLGDLVGPQGAAALVRWVGAVAVQAGPDVVAVLADLVTGSGPLGGLVSGAGTPSRPFALPLAPVAGAPELLVWFPGSVERDLFVAAGDEVTGWRPGDIGLAADVLARALVAEADVDPAVEDLVWNRSLVAGLEGLIARWTGTDGRIVPPAAAPDAVSVVRLPDLAAGQLGAELDLAGLLASEPPVVVRVRVAETSAEAFPDAPPERVVDLTAPNRPPASFAAPAPAAGEWFVALAPRAAAALPAGDPDGSIGQARRLEQVLVAFAGLGSGQVVVAEGGAGHAARLAAAASGAVSDVVTVGTPLGPVAFSVLDDAAAGDAWRLLDSLSADMVADDPDLARGRALVDALADVDAFTDPGRELRVPAGGYPVAAGVRVTAVFGVVSEPAARRAVTAVVAAGLAARARRRWAAGPGTPDGSTGIRLALRQRVAGDPDDPVVVDGELVTDLGGWHVDEAGASPFDDAVVRVRVRVGIRNGWLAGGPDPLRGPGRPRDHAVRAVTVEASVPRGSTAVGAGRVVVHDGRAFTVRRERWELAPDGEPMGAEARLLLSLAMGRVVAEGEAATASPAATSVRAVLQALALATADGSVADAFEELVHDPAALVGAALADPVRRQALAGGARGLLKAAAPAAGDDPARLRWRTGAVTVVADLASRTLTVDAPDAGGRFGWAASVSLRPGARAWEVRIGSDDDAPASPTGAAWLRINPSAAVLTVRPAGGRATAVSLWPTVDGAALGDTVVRVAPALLATVALDHVRAADAVARPVVDAALAALGLLDSATGALRLPVGLLTEPLGWLRHSVVLGADPGRLMAVLDSVKPLLGVAGGAGILELAPGVTLSASDAGGAFLVEASIDTSAFPAPAATPLGRLVAGLRASVRIPSGAAPQVTLDAFVGLGGAAAGRRALHLTLGDDLSLFLRPAAGADVSLYPAGPGLGAVAADAAGRALPFLLDRLAAQSGSSLPGRIGSVVAAVGDALGLRDTTPHFTYDRLAAFAADPPAMLVAAAGTSLPPALQSLVDAVDAALPAGVAVTRDGSALRVVAGVTTVVWTPAPFRLVVTARATAIPVVGPLEATVAVTAAGIDEATLVAGPASVPAGPLELRPVLGVHAGASPAGGRRVDLGIALDATRSIAVRWALGPPASARLTVLGGPSPVTDAEEVALALAEAATTVAASIALATAEVDRLLSVAVGTTTVRQLLRGVVLRPNDTFDQGVFAPATLLRRVGTLLDNLAGANLSVTVDGALTVGLAKPGGVVGVSLSLNQRLELTSGDVTVWLEVDDDWIDPAPAAPGIAVGLVRLDGGTVVPAPSLSAAGVGVRVGRRSGPLLDAGVTIESVALHLFGAVGSGPSSGGVNLEISNLAVPVSGASGGNAIASGILADSGGAGRPPTPSFSPALAVQKHGGDPVAVKLRAGAGDGPWWVAIQKGFGPLYIEQIGLGVSIPERTVSSVSLLLDARVSLFGLNAAVDDLSITYFVTRGSVFDPGNWEVDLAGLAVSADIGPLSIAGGLLKSGGGNDVEYLGMLLGRFGVYGLTIYGGYGKRDGVVSFFAVGAVVGPIGGVPAFFVTGIGGGFGINRALRVPTDLSQFGEFPLLKALDVAASPPADPMGEMRRLGAYFPPQQGTFWFAAGLSFNSFALVDGIAVVAVQVGDGFEVSLLGLARMALPRPQAAIVSIELALLVRISSREGVIWVQGQLTDNSWLLYPDVRLTGGFAYVIWFAGPHRGEFVLTMGGFHPDFSRDGYPQVPRLGLQWSIGSAIVVKGGAYFALTSEAVMAGVDVEVSASFGWAWARLTFGAHGIVFFDPFHYRVNAYVRIAAGITIDTWFGDITISISRGAELEVEGPDFHGRARISVGPCTVTVPFGSSDDNTTPRLQAPEFVRKYLEEGAPGLAQAISSIVSAGALPPKTSGGPAPEPPDGSAARPFVVTAEFVLTVTTTVPATGVDVGATVRIPPTGALGIAPMGTPAIDPTLTLRWHDGVPQPWPFGAARPMPLGAFPLGVWGPPQDAAAPRVPTGEVVEALSQVQVVSKAAGSGGGPPIDYNQLDPSGPRRPLPFLRNSGQARTDELRQARRLTRLVAAAAAGADVAALADAWRAGAGASAVELASWQNQRRGVQPLLGSLGDRLARRDDPVVPTAGDPVDKPPVDTTVHPPVVLAVLGAGTRLEGALAGGSTTVSDRPRAARMAPPTMAALRNVPASAKLVVGGAAARSGRSVVAGGAPAVTRPARVPGASVATRGGAGRGRLEAMTAGLGGTRAGGVRVGAGETAVLALPNAARDVDEGRERPVLAWTGCPTRVTMLAPGGSVVAEARSTSDAGTLAVPRGTERVVVSAIGEGFQEPALSGWHAGMTLPYVGWGTALAVGSSVHVDGTPLARKEQRYRAGFVEAAELVSGTSTVETRLLGPVDVVLVVLDDPAADAGRRLVVGLDGARRPVGPDGQEQPPLVVTLGNRTVLAYRVVPDTEAAPAVVVGVASGGGWHLVGVLGGVGAPADVAGTLAARGFDAVLGTASTGRGEVEVRWQPAPGGPVPDRARPPARPPRRPTGRAVPTKTARPRTKAAAEKAAAKKAAAEKAAGSRGSAVKTATKKTTPAEKAPPATKKTGAGKAGAAKKAVEKAAGPAPAGGRRRTRGR